MKFNALKSAAAGVVFAGALFGASAAQAGDNADATAFAEIVTDVSITKTSDLQFGSIVKGAAAADVTVSTGGSRTCGSGLVCFGSVTAAAFDVAGAANKVVTIGVPASVSLVSGANSMSADLSGSAATVTLDGAGDGSLTVGGTLHVGANQADGQYQGDFNVTADYQ